MIFSRFLQRTLGPLGRHPGHVSTLHAAEEALAEEGEAVRLNLAAAADVACSDQQTSGEGGGGSEEERREGELRRKEQKNRETRELLVLQQVLPNLLQRRLLEGAENVVGCFVDRNPRNADGFVLLADVYSQRNNLVAACECLWGAVYNSPGNRTLLRLLRDWEENFFLRQCELPLAFRLRCLDTSNPQDHHPLPPCGSELASLFSAEGSPVVVSRQGKHVAVRTNRALQPGDVVFRQKPFVLTPLMLPGGLIYSSCFHCLQDREDSSRGYSCPVSPHTCPFVFCSWECLMRNSRIHALECQAIPILLAAAKESGFSSTTVLHIFRTLAKAGLERQFRENQTDAQEPEETPLDVIEQLLQLNSYRDAVLQGQPELHRRLTILARRLQRELPAQLLLFLDEDDLIELMLILWQYSPLLTSPSVASAVEGGNPDGATGQVLAPAVALLHHSCVPTCGVSLQEDGLVVVRALTSIPAGGSLCVSLEPDLYQSQKTRKGSAAMPRVFGCGCVRCRDTLEGGRQLRGIRCFSCVRGFLNPRKSASLESRLRPYSNSLVLLPTPSSSTQPAKEGKTDVVQLRVLTPLSQKDTPTASTGKEGEGAIEGRGAQEQKGREREDWLCTWCGLASAEVRRSCEGLEREVESQQKQAEEALVSGARILARKLYEELVQQYSSLLHPQHAVLFNAHTVLAGLLACQPAKDPLQALIYGRRAAIAAESVLPPCSRLKMDLHLKLADWTYQASQLDQHCRRGTSVPPAFIMSPMYSALWNCYVCFGGESSLTIVLQQKLRRYAALFRVSTPPLMQQPVLRTANVFVAVYRQVTGSQKESDQAIAEHFKRDPLFLGVALVRRGFCFPLALELFHAMKDVAHLPTGLTLLGLACSYKQVQVVKELLKMGYDMLHATALGITPLLALCGEPRAHVELEEDLSLCGLPAVEAAAVVADLSRREVLTLQALLQHCEKLDTEQAKKPPALLGQGLSPLKPPPPSSIALRLVADVSGNNSLSPRAKREQSVSHRRRLLSACTHKLLGRSAALHLAASAGKAKLCRQLVAAGSVVGALNAELATALHLACVAGDVPTVKVLLESGANPDAVTNRGETPLMMAAYHLHWGACSLLLERGADPSVISKAEGLSVLHAVAAGVMRQVSVSYRELAWEGDGPARALTGFSVASQKLGIYAKTNPSILQEAMVDLRLPSARPISSDCFLFPETMLERVEKAKKVLLVMIKHCPFHLFSLKSRKGLSPAELLLRMWDEFATKRQKFLVIGDLQLEGRTKEERTSLEGKWDFVLHQIVLLREALRPRLRSYAEQPPRSQYVDTPRRDELEQQDKDRLIAEAPWLFPDLLQHPNARGPSKASVPNGSQVKATSASQLQPGLGGTGSDAKQSLDSKQPAPQTEEGPSSSQQVKGGPPSTLPAAPPSDSLKASASSPVPKAQSNAPPPPPPSKGPPSSTKSEAPAAKKPPAASKGPPPGSAKGPPSKGEGAQPSPPGPPSGGSKGPPPSTKGAPPPPPSKNPPPPPSAKGPPPPSTNKKPPGGPPKGPPKGPPPPSSSKPPPNKKPPPS